MNKSTTKKASKWHKWKKVILAWVVFFLVLLLAYLLIAGLGAPKFDQIEAVPNNFQDPALALVWYLRVVWINNIFGVLSIFLALLSFVGYLVLKRGLVDSFLGALKTAIGVLLLQIGANAIVGISRPLFDNIRTLFGQNVVPLDPYLGWTSANNFLEKAFSGNNFLSWPSYVVIIAFFWNVLLVAFKRYTNTYAVMTTGHIMFQQATLVTVFVYILFFRFDSFTTSKAIVTILFSGVFLGTYWAYATTLNLAPTNKITENANFAIGHQQMIAIALAYKIGRLFAKNSKSAENLKLNPKFRIFEDNIFVQSLIILVLFLILGFIIHFNTAGGLLSIPAFNSGFYGQTLGTFWVLKLFLGAFFAVAALLAIITGVRMFVTELQQSFQGISEKILPGSTVAVDIAAVYGFAPNSVVYGFLSGVLGQFLAVGVSIGLATVPNLVAIPIPLFITLFFNSGAIGVYANASGGYKATLVVPFLFGFLEILTIAFALGRFSFYGTNGSLSYDPSFFPTANGYNGMADWNLFFGFFSLFAAFHPISAYVIFAFLTGIMLFLAQFVNTHTGDILSPIQKLKKNWINKRRIR